PLPDLFSLSLHDALPIFSLVFAELLAHPGVEEQVELRSRFGFLAIHGGSLERGTAEVADAAAEQAGASLYAVRQPDDLRWHVPSDRKSTRLNSSHVKISY